MNTPKPVPEPPLDASDLSVRLVSGRHRWRVTCARGEEPAMLECLVEHALSEDSPIRLEDVALIRARLAGVLRIGVNKAPATPDRA
ncbi:MAG: hypothetical protein R3B57_12225 [Phycisphaerales bacterium]